MYVYYLIAAGIAAFALGVIFSPGISRLIALLVSDVKKEYTKALEELKALYAADTQKFRAEVDRISTLYDTDVAKLKSDWAAEVLKLKADLGEANNKVGVLTSVIKSATVLAAAATAPAPARNETITVGPAIATASTTATTRTKAQIAADLASAQAAETQLQAELAAATE